MPVKIAFIGLGVMGFPMAGHLVSAGHHVTVFNRTQSKVKNWCEVYSGFSASTPASAANDADFVFACVGDDADVRAVTTAAQGAFAGMKRGSVFVDHTTASAEVALELEAAAHKLGICFMDAPVSGGEAGAVNGELTVMLGGEQDVYLRVQPVISAYAKASELIGPVGHGQKAKMVNQICIAGLVQALSEGLNFARAGGLNIEKVINAISKGAAQSWQMENRYQAMVDGKFDFGFAVDWMRKDLQIVLDEAARLGAPVPVTKTVNEFYADVQKMGGGRWDTCSLIALLSKNTE